MNDAGCERFFEAQALRFPVLMTLQGDLPECPYVKDDCRQGIITESLIDNEAVVIDASTVGCYYKDTSVSHQGWTNLGPR